MPKRSDNPTIKPINGPSYVITPDDHGKILDWGPATNGETPGVMILQFTPDVNYVGSVAVMGVVFGPVSDALNTPFLPVPYRRVTVNNVASDYQLVADQITGPSKIQIPANGDAIGLLVVCTAGSCTLVRWNMNGPSAV